MEVGPRRRTSSSKVRQKGGRVSKASSAAEEARRAEVLKETLREKLELERRAHQVVERLLEDSVTEEFLTDCAHFITSANYKDAVEERSIAKICGYPVCPNTLTNVLTQKYKISTKSNKVYDITERKCYCSNFCYKASKCFEVQISKSPLWLRKGERPPDIKLMKKGDGGSSGLEVKLSDKPVSEADIENPILEPTELNGGSSGPSDSSDVEQDFVSSVVAGDRPKARVHWGALPKRDGRNEEEQLHKGQSSGKDTREQNMEVKKGNVNETNGMSTTSPKPIDLPGSPHLDAPVEETRKLLDHFVLSEVSPSKVMAQEAPADVNPESCDANTKDTHLNISHVGMSKKSAAGLKSLLKSHVKMKTDAPSVKHSLLESLRITLKEWRTEETMRFLYGSDYTLQAEPTPQSEEEELDEDDLEDIEDVQEKVKRLARPTAAAPDYETLRKETELLDVRVREFYKGVCILPEEDQVDVSGDPEVSDRDPPLPPVDSQAQLLIQKRITVEKLSRSLRDIVGPLRLTMSEIINDINSLVRTFRFTSTNIIHKPPEWTLIAAVLLLVLTQVSPLLKESMAEPTSAEYISSLMKELRLEDQDLQSLVQIFKPNGQMSSS